MPSPNDQPASTVFEVAETVVDHHEESTEVGVVATADTLAGAQMFITDDAQARGLELLRPETPLTIVGQPDMQAWITEYQDLDTGFRVFFEVTTKPADD